MRRLELVFIGFCLSGWGSVALAALAFVDTDGVGGLKVLELRAAEFQKFVVKADGEAAVFSV